MAHVKTAPQPKTPTGHAAPNWRQTTLAPALLGSLLMFAALPPIDLWPLAWIAPLPWLGFVRRETLLGKRPYRDLWIAGFVFWLLAIHWLRLPHWATHFGWLALAFYLAFYVPVFVGLTRVAVHRVGISLVIAAPVVWTGLEFARAHLLSGFLMGSLGHTQYRWVELIQISDLFGAYGVSFVVMLVAACLARMWPRGGRIAYWPLAPAALALAATWGYGAWRITQETPLPGPRVALVQGSIDADWKADPDKSRRIFEQYFGLSEQAVRESAGKLDLIVWPETMFRNTLYQVKPDYAGDPQQAARYREAEQNVRSDLAIMAHRLQTPLVLGIDAGEVATEGMRYYNSAVAVAREGQVVGLYSKTHRVMFGEYVPLAKAFPWLYQLTPLSGGMEPGARPEAFTLGEVRYAPNICYESTVPHVIRDQVRTLAAEGKRPDVLLNLTNDAWFWGSSELEMHLACGVFRAVETRTPFLVAANSGISAHIDSSGRLLAQSPKRQTDVILADVTLDPRVSPYLTVGDWPAGVCLAACLALAGMGLVDCRRGRNTSRAWGE